MIISIFFPLIYLLHPLFFFLHSHGGIHGGQDGSVALLTRRWPWNGRRLGSVLVAKEGEIGGNIERLVEGGPAALDGGGGAHGI